MWAALTLVFWPCFLIAVAETSHSEIILPQLHRFDPVEVSCLEAACRTEGTAEVWVFEGTCEVQQGPSWVRGERGVGWRSVAPGGEGELLHLYVEGDVEVAVTTGQGIARIHGPSWQYAFETLSGVRIQPARQIPINRFDGKSPWPGKGSPGSMAFGTNSPGKFPWIRPGGKDPTALAARPSNRPMTGPMGAGPPAWNALSGREDGAKFPAGTSQSWGPTSRQHLSRSDIPVQVEWRHNPARDEWIGLVTSGVNILIQGTPPLGPWKPEVIDIATDRMVLWTRGKDQPDLSGQQPLADDMPLEIYMEGNIVFREGQRIVYADRMYYDVRRRIGVLVDAELLSPVPEYEGLLRVHAQILRQLGPERFRAEHAFVTSSRMGFPTYRLQAGVVELEVDRQPVFDPSTGAFQTDPETGEVVTEPRYELIARDNALYLGPLPVLVWPEIATDLTEPSFLLRRLRVKNDSVFGFQVLSDWDAYQVLGLRSRPAGTRWDISLDLLSDRGLGHGTTFLYRGEEFLGIPGAVTGLVDFWGIQDDGFDNLGRGRRAIEPEKNYRWRLLWQHRQLLPGDWHLTAEAGWISDRNFLEQYFEREWDELKDLSTGIELKRLQENRSLALSADVRINNFFTQTDWLPRLDHFWLGEALFAEHLTWYQRTTIGLARLRTASFPEDPRPYFSYRQWETSDGVTPLGRVPAERVGLATRIGPAFAAWAVQSRSLCAGGSGPLGEDRFGRMPSGFWARSECAGQLAALAGGSHLSKRVVEPAKGLPTR